MKNLRRLRLVTDDGFAAEIAHANGLRAVAPPRTPTGECPLCYSPNPYTAAVCDSCGLPLPWADAVPAEPEPCGWCQRCGAENPFSLINCQGCGTRLPWSNAVKAAQREARSASESYPPPPPAPVRAAVLDSVGSPQAAFASFQVADPATQAVQVVSFVAPPMGFVTYVNLLTRAPEMAIAAAASAIYGIYVWGGLLLFWFLLSFVSGHRGARYKAPSGPPNYTSKVKSG